MLYTLVSTASGWVGIACSDNGVRRLNLPVQDEQAALALLGIGNATDLHKGDGIGSLRRQVTEYFSGKRAVFDCKMDLSGSTPFQRKVWRATMDIPYCQVRSYKWVAEKIGKPSACRAVGHALAANPLPLIIPCHRVIRSDGGPGGFGGRSTNVKTKLMLLSLEGYRFGP
ncbi:MAG: methylated-DNA--[protein]-cysteine S-methyltransferase [Chloroflexi bacterium]|nr:methylated-DNA--[protein]-cysteine S-methyltransferase [Chloroflexota bacterium]